MSNLPADLSPETAAWMRLQMTIAAARAVRPISERMLATERILRELDQVDDWANGVFAVLLDLVPALLRRWPELAGDLKEPWKRAADAFDLVERHGPMSGIEETAESLEGRKIMYRVLEQLGAWQGATAQHQAMERRRA